MRVLVSGGTGFLGSHVIRRLVKDSGLKVGIVMRSESNPWRISDVLDSVDVIRCDLGKPDDVSTSVRDWHPDVVCNLAWYGVGNRYRDDPQQVYRNIGQSLSFLRFAAESGCKRWIGLGSQAEYGRHQGVTSEAVRTEPITLYGLAKLSTCLLSQRLCEHYEMSFAWTRLFSAYGPADSPGWMVPYLILTLLRGGRPSLTLGEQLWDYIFAPDAAEAIYRLSQRPEATGVFNLGSGQAYPIRYVAETIRDFIDPHLLLGFGDVHYGTDQIMHLQADISRLTNAIAWTPNTHLVDGLQRTIEWYQRNRHHYA